MRFGEKAQAWTFAQLHGAEDKWRRDLRKKPPDRTCWQRPHLPLDHRAVDRNLLARPHAQPVADRDRIERDFLFAALGAWLGWQLLVPLILVAASVGAVTGIVILAVKGKDPSTPIPFGPYLAAAGWLMLLFGHELVAGSCERRIEERQDLRGRMLAARRYPARHAACHRISQQGPGGGLGRPGDGGEHGEGVAASAPGFRGQAVGGAAGFVAVVWAVAEGCIAPPSAPMAR